MHPQISQSITPLKIFELARYTCKQTCINTCTRLKCLCSHAHKHGVLLLWLLACIYKQNHASKPSYIKFSLSLWSCTFITFLFLFCKLIHYKVYFIPIMIMMSSLFLQHASLPARGNSPPPSSFWLNRYQLYTSSAQLTKIAKRLQ